MDFISLAEETSPKNLLRHLGHDGVGRHRVLDELPSVSGGTNLDGSSQVPNMSSSSPLLSEDAEFELYLMATNFLLYVAMVIVTIIVAKVYFPESLEPREGSLQRPRSFHYRMAADVVKNSISNSNSTTTTKDGNTNKDVVGDEDYYASDADDVYDDDDDEDDDEEVLDDNGDIPRKVTTTTTTTTTVPQRPSGMNIRTSSYGKSISGNFLEFQQESLSKGQVLRRLLFCCLMLNITFVTWGVLQERMLTRKYPRYTGEYFTYSYALVFTNRFWTFIMSGMLLMYFKPKASKTTVIYEYTFPSISNMMSSWCQYESLRYVSFPATTLFKSFKLAPVMIMGVVLGNKSYPQYDYIVALLIGIGIAMFMTSTDELSFGYDYLGNDIIGGGGGTTTIVGVGSAWTGVMLLFFFLLFDSFTSQFQSRMFQRHRDLSMVELMFATSAFSTVLSFVTLLHTKELYPAFDFVMKHNEIHIHFLLFSICSTIGQLFIFYTIKNFGAVVFTLIMTTRILLSIGLSCVLYGHKVTATGFFGLMLVMAAVLYRIQRKAQGQQLLKWRGMPLNDDEKEYELVQEWHEHVDM